MRTVTSSSGASPNDCTVCPAFRVSRTYAIGPGACSEVPTPAIVDQFLDELRGLVEPCRAVGSALGRLSVVRWGSASERRDRQGNAVRSGSLDAGSSGKKAVMATSASVIANGRGIGRWVVGAAVNSGAGRT